MEDILKMNLGMMDSFNVIKQQTEDDAIAQAKLQKTCSQCEKIKEGLSRCGGCRSTFYCNSQCQKAHWVGGHKKVCKELSQFPATPSWKLFPVQGCKYPRNPILAKVSDDGVSMWVTVGGSIKCQLQDEIYSGFIGGTSEKYMRRLRMDKYRLNAMDPRDVRKIIGKTVMKVEFMIQNKRQDGGSIAFLPADAYIVGEEEIASFYPSCEKPPEIVDGKAIIKVHRDCDSNICLQITDINGKQLEGDLKKAPLPEIVNRDPLTICLGPGDFAIVEAQYRVGNGENVSTDPEALQRFHSFCIPVFKTDKPSLFKEQLNKGLLKPTLISAKWNQDGIFEHYRDLFEKGEDEYIRTHFGEQRMKSMQQAESGGPAMLEMLMKGVYQHAGAEGLKYLRDSIKKAGGRDIGNM
eukprot:TRINITY_DN96_c0_g1_i2.p1 TRINITY_DN96_c0_g1~~TRINITY_DN96_c0_g1_i2.p1  ORF type:complete len:407 (+),score=52.53 TRINITY_DN96_c0_g1_i2:285-1505(+)